MKITGLIFFLIGVFSFANAQPFAEEITVFKQQDSISFPSKSQILFIGSSSFTNWKDVQDYFPKHKILNRGFGGSSLTDVMFYADKIIFPYQPKQIVIYCGENDIAGDSTVTGKIVFERFQQLFLMIRKELPKVPVAYISMKPSPARWYLKEKVIQGNKLIQQFLKTKPKTGFINVWPQMLNGAGEPKEELFLEDKLHMNKSGYAIWQKLIQPILIK